VAHAAAKTMGALFLPVMLLNASADAMQI
jgi:hypothetical protein